MSETPKPMIDRKGCAYTPAVGPGLKRLLIIIFAVVALLGANSVYLVSITILGEQYQNAFYMLMFALHLLLGLGLLLPFLFFAFRHLATSYNRPNRRAVRAGFSLLIVSLLLIFSGLILVRFAGFSINDPTVRRVAYWMHVICPLVAIAFYVTHRMAGPLIKWRWAWGWAGAVGVFVTAMGYLHHLDPRIGGAVGPKQGQRYFAPSSARTVTGNFIPEQSLLMDNYCQKCHPDAYEQHYQSVHHFSSFNNKPYLFSVQETRQVSLKRDNSVQASRWCAGCHDPVPFFSGRFDNPDYDIKNKSDPTTQAGITCTVCHGITHVNDTTGNASYTIDEAEQYPFAFSANPVLQWVNNQLIKAKPELHKKTFLKPFHRSAEFCSTCHKVSLPFALNHYKEWLRGQDHYNPFLLSGVSGHGVQSFYYPDKAKGRCADCHMPLAKSEDFGARDFDQLGGRKIHNHLFVGANTGLPFLRNFELLREAAGGSGLAKPEDLSGIVKTQYERNESLIAIHQGFLQDGQLRADIFAIKPGGEIVGELIAPLRPEVPTLAPGPYLVEVVLRTLKLGHLFTQGTTDSNEVWVDFEARSGDRVIGRSGAIEEDGSVDPWSHFVNALVIDRQGNRIDRRNPQDIYVAAYSHQIPPGAGQVVHFQLNVPDDLNEPIRLTAKLQYRKFDRKYMSYVFKEDGGPIPNLPITTLCEDSIMLPVDGVITKVENPESKIPLWQRWNDYGIGLLLEGGEQGGGSEKGELRQAEQAFQKVTELGYGDGYANLARVYLRERRLADAVQALQSAASKKATAGFPAGGAGATPPQAPPKSLDPMFKPAAAWTVAWLTGMVNKGNGQLDEAMDNLELLLSDEMQAAVANRGFDFTRDFRVWNELGILRADRSEQERGPRKRVERERWLRNAVSAFQHTLAIEPEDLTAHFKLAEVYGTLAGRESDSQGAQVDPSPADAITADASASDSATARGKSTSAADLRTLAVDVANAQRADQARINAAGQLARLIPEFLRADRDPFESRRSALVEILAICQPSFPSSPDASLGDTHRATAEVLHVLHRSLHQMYKADDNARAAIAIHRQNNAAANHAAQSIVVYPLNRPGAPGLVESQPKSSATESSSGGE